MPYNGTGTFSIVNQFIPLTTILSAAVNQNFTDIATGLSDVLTRDGQAGMTAPLGLTSGTSSVPSLTANSDATSGLYFPATGVVALVANALGVQVNSEIYQALSATVSAGGSGYAVGDTIYLTGGTSAVVACATVATLSGSAVATVTMTVPGIYTAKPTNPVSQGSTSGAGSGCTLTVTWNDPTSSAFRLALMTLTNALIWQTAGASSFVSGLMAKANGLDFATAIGASNIVTVISNTFTFTPQGYLTPTSNTPVITGDVTAATSLYYTPYLGNMIPIYNGTNLVQTTFTQTQCTLTAGAQASAGIYDVYGFLNSGTFTVGFSPTWSAGTSGSVTAGSCARGTGAGGTALTRVNGILTNTVSMTVNNGATTYSVAASQGTYLGSIYVNATAGQLNCYRAFGQSRVWGIWNAYNRVPVILQAGDSTASWAYNTGTIRESNGGTTNLAIGFCGLAEEEIAVRFNQYASLVTGGADTISIGIGVNATNAFTGMSGSFNGSVVTVGSTMAATYIAPPALGINSFNCCELGNASGTNTFFGTSANMLLSAIWRA